MKREKGGFPVKWKIETLETLGNAPQLASLTSEMTAAAAAAPADNIEDAGCDIHSTYFVTRQVDGL